MDSNDAGQYFLWGADQTAYGPVPLPVLVEWTRDERVTADSWIYRCDHRAWQPAAAVPELKLFFPAAPAPASAAALALKPATLRRIKVFAELADEQIQELIQRMELLRVKQWQEVVRQGEPGDAMFLILEGELRVRLLVNGRESTLATLQTGDFFGEVSLFDAGPRSADVVANQDSLLLKISSSALADLATAAPRLAATFLLTMGKTMTARLRTANKRYRDSLLFARSANAVR